VSQYTLHHGDCLDVLPTLEAQSADAVICDPPYGTTACKWDAVIPFAPMWAEIKRVLKPRGACVLFGSQPFTSALVMSNPGWFKYSWVWSKNTGGNPGVLKSQPNRTHEDILVFGNAGHKYNPQRQRSISSEAIRNAQRGAIIHRQGSKSNHTSMVMRDGAWNEYVQPTSVQFFESVPRATGSIHPTEKPLALLEYLVKTYTDKGDVVLDFTMGSGTTGHACMNLGRCFIGIERDAGYFAIARERIMDAADPLRHMEAA
jgi:site-specific DNA-methyltransferase (adenine-specific)